MDLSKAGMGHQWAIRTSVLFTALSILAGSPDFLESLITSVGYFTVESIMTPIIDQARYDQLDSALTQLMVPSLLLGSVLGTMGFVFALIALRGSPGGNRRARRRGIVLLVLSGTVAGYLAFILLGGILLGYVVLW